MIYITDFGSWHIMSPNFAWKVEFFVPLAKFIAAFKLFTKRFITFIFRSQYLTEDTGIDFLFLFRRI